MTTYSAPLKKEEIAELYTRVFGDLPPALKVRFIKKLSEYNDVKLVKDFNKTMNLRIRLFAPGMYQIVYN